MTSYLQTVYAVGQSAYEQLPSLDTIEDIATRVENTVKQLDTAVNYGQKYSPEIKRISEGVLARDVSQIAKSITTIGIAETSHKWLTPWISTILFSIITMILVSFIKSSILSITATGYIIIDLLTFVIVSLVLERIIQKLVCYSHTNITDMLAEKIVTIFQTHQTNTTSGPYAYHIIITICLGILYVADFSTKDLSIMLFKMLLLNTVRNSLV